MPGNLFDPLTQTDPRNLLRQYGLAFFRKQPVGEEDRPAQPDMRLKRMSLVIPDGTFACSNIVLRMGQDKPKRLKNFPSKFN
jgi:hypothetical protein